MYMYVCMCVCVCIYIYIYVYISNNPSPGRALQRPGRLREPGPRDAPGGDRGFRGCGFRLCTNRYDITRGTAGLIVVVCLLLRIRAP